MDRLPSIRAAFQNALRQNADVFYRHTGSFVLGTHTWVCRFSVEDPDGVSRTAIAAAEAAAQRFAVDYRDLRLLKLHPDDPYPVRGARLPWDGGTLEILEWSQPGGFTDLKTATCVIRR